MYHLDEVLPDEAVERGTNLLVTGPAMAGKRRLGLRVLATGSSAGEGAVVVTTSEGADRVLDEFGEYTGLNGAAVGVVDCVSDPENGERPDSVVRYADSPVDMTGMGIALSSVLEEFYAERGLQRNRILLDSVSTPLTYADLQNVFQFLHVFTGRVADAGALGLYVLDESAHDEQTANTLRQLFDGELVVGEDGEPVTLRGG